MASGASEEKVGEFTINVSDILGSGAFGTVTKGTDANGEPVAAKKISLVDERKARKVSDDLERLKTLDHQNTVKIFEVNRQQMALWIFMEYCQYGDLKDFFKKRSLTDRQKFEMMHQIGMGVEYLHSKDIIHRDIKPQNILVAGEKPVVVKLTDFDCSKFLDPQYVTSCMSTNVGTPAFKAPEFFKRVKVEDKTRIKYHRNIDIYAAGLTFLAMIQGNGNLAPRIETANNESECFIPIGQLIAERIKYKKNPLEILKFSRSKSASNFFSRLLGKRKKPLSAEGERIQQLRELIREMTRAEPTDRISAAQVVQEIRQILQQTPAEVNITVEMTVSSRLCPWIHTRFTVLQTGHMVFWGKSSWESPAALHIFTKSPEGLEKVREETGFCEHTLLYLSPFRAEFLAVACSSCQKIKLYNTITTELTEAFHDERLLMITAAAAEEGVMYVRHLKGVLKLNTEQFPFTVTQVINVELQLTWWNMIHIPEPHNLFVFSEDTSVSAVSCDSGEKRWKHSGEGEDSLRGSGAVCYSKEHQVLLVGNSHRILVLDPEDGSHIHTVELGKDFQVILDFHIHDETLIVHHIVQWGSEETKVSLFALE